jgi:hypothetical protein
MIRGPLEYKMIIRISVEKFDKLVWYVAEMCPRLEVLVGGPGPSATIPFLS